MQKVTLILLSIFFVFLSFSPTLYEVSQQNKLPENRAFELVHNYVFDYNFYLSRIREGQEGRWAVVEKYYNQPHSGSLFQIFYLYLGKLGGLFSLSPVFIYHTARVILGLILLLIIGKLVSNIFPGWWSVVGYLLIVIASSWPILVKLGNGFRFSTYMGWWSVIDSLQRITFIPHVLLGQIFLILFIWRFSDKLPKSLKLLIWGITGLIAGIIFPPVLIAIYTIFFVLSVIELIQFKSPKSLKFLKSEDRIKERLLPRIVFILCSFPALLYLQVMFRVEPWQALAVFDIQHRSILPYTDYFLALGPMLPLGIAGMILALVKKERKFIPFVSWILSLGLLFAVFEHVPQQSPTRFTQMLINIPLGILATYLFYSLWQMCDKYKRSLAYGIKIINGVVITTVIIMGLGVMFSMVGWLTDQVKWKKESTWLVPTGTQLVYPLADFMNAVYFLRDNTRTSDIVLAYEGAGNYIPAYAGNFVYLGHANTPNEDGKLKIAEKFFKGSMSEEEAREFLARENIKFIYFGPQEQELGGIKDLEGVYPFVLPLYKNNQVVVYKTSGI